MKPRTQDWQALRETLIETTVPHQEETHAVTKINSYTMHLVEDKLLQRSYKSII